MDEINQSEDVKQDKKSSIWKRLSAVLLQKDFPYIITLMVAILGYGVTTIVDSIIKVPVISMQENYVKASQDKMGKYSVTLVNLTSDKNFQDFTVVLTSTEYKLKFLNHKYRVRAPGWSPNPTVTKSKNEIYYRFENLMPGVAVEIKADVEGDIGIPHIRVKSSKSGFQFLEPGFRTFLINNEMWILIIIYVFFPTFILFRWVISNLARGAADE